MNGIDIIICGIAANVATQVVVAIALRRTIKRSLIDIIYSTRETAIQAKRAADAVELGLAVPIREEQARNKSTVQLIMGHLKPAMEALKQAMKKRNRQ